MVLVYFPLKRPIVTKRSEHTSGFYCLHTIIKYEAQTWTFSLRVSSQFILFASLNGQRSLRSAVGLNTFNPQHSRLWSFSFFPENPLSLPTIATLPVMMLFSLGVKRIFAFLILCHFVGLVLTETFLQKVW